MSGERNRRSLAFRGGGLTGVAAASGTAAGNCNSCEAPTCQDRPLNGNGPDREEDGNPRANGTSLGAGSVSDSTEPEAEEEEDPEGGSGESDERVGSVEAEEGCGEAGNGGLTATNGPGSGAEMGSRKSGVEMRPQTLLQKNSVFLARWLQEFPWLKFCQETGLMSCSWCYNIAAKSSDELAKGSRNYKRPLLLRHHLSSEHGRNDPTKQVRLSLEPVAISSSCHLDVAPRAIVCFHSGCFVCVFQQNPSENRPGTLSFPNPLSPPPLAY